MNKIETGSKVFYRGDMANHEGWFTVTGFRPATKYSAEHVELMEIDGEFRSKSIPTHMVDHIDSGNGSTRFVTEAAYEARRAKLIAEYQA